MIFWRRLSRFAPLLAVAVLFTLIVSLLNVITNSYFSRSDSRTLRGDNSGSKDLKALNSEIPLILYQTYKTSTISDLDISRRIWAQSWRNKNPKLKHRIFNDKDLDKFMKDHFSKRDSITKNIFSNAFSPFFGLWKSKKSLHATEKDLIWRAFNKLPFRVQKTDLWRYVIVYTLGGIYADMDVECIQGFEKWFGTQEDSSSVKFIAGLEVLLTD
jgi:mannosyltransferase OCH1-like enzyme